MGNIWNLNDNTICFDCIYEEAWFDPIWCLGHNFDIVATILTMASVSWQKGFDAGLTIANFAPEGHPFSVDS